MASVSQVRAYLGYWFQLGKPVVFQKSQTQCLPNPIFQGSCFSSAFEQCWQRIVENPADCHLQGTEQTLGCLLADNWDITDCARCSMPVPMPVGAVSSSPCPCFDLALWPNDDIPQPRLPLAEKHHLGNIRDRLSAANALRDRLKSSYDQSASLPNSGVEQTLTKDQDAIRQDATRAADS